MKPLKLKDVLNELYSEDFNAIKDLVKKYANKFAKRGIHVGQSIGSGDRGIAFSTTDNKVLKITIDQKEAISSFHIVGKKLKHVCQIYDVFTIPGTKFYCILQEQLTKIQEGTPLKKVLRDQGTFLYMKLGIFKEGPESDMYMRQKLVELVKEYVGNDAELNKVYRQVRGLKEAEKELESNNIDFADWHVGNIMLRGDDLVVIDLGNSHAAKVSLPEL